MNAIARALREFAARLQHLARDKRDFAIINRHAARLNREAEEVLAYQAVDLEIRLPQEKR